MKQDTITLDHGSGGKMSRRLIAEAVLPAFDDPALRCLDDGAVLAVAEGRIAFSTDTFVVDPIFFPGGNIGDLAVNGTVNDLAMCGAVPRYLSVAMIIEEGFPRSDLDRILQTMRRAARAACVRIVTGDTKVVPRGAADKIFINTAGIGVVPAGVHVFGANARVGDRVLLSGTMADHGMTILTQREGLRFDSPLESDTAPLNHLAARMIEGFGPAIHVLRDPTRGGVGTALNEIALSSGVGIAIHEDRLPVRASVAGVCELLGFDPLYVANEGKLVAVVAPEAAREVLALMHADPLGKDACIIGEVVSAGPAPVVMETRIGGTRIVDMLTGEQLPRIC
ncbi:hydrogenase expression/formation protein HypE [Desulfococcus sp.]|uniref:hydrogenase expression/formation protein HypE n=1 Tax=Desulfococcus sp. TaxID=2025834 RepID=UPI003593B0DB